MPKRSSRTRLFGVREFRGRYRAVYEHKYERKLIAECATAREAGERFDEYIIKKRGIIRAFPFLNSPSAYREAYVAALDERENRQRALQEQFDVELRSRPVPPSEYASVMARHHAGESAESIAASLGVHADTVKVCLRELEIERLASLGLRVDEVPGASTSQFSPSQEDVE